SQQNCGAETHSPRSRTHQPQCSKMVHWQITEFEIEMAPCCTVQLVHEPKQPIQMRSEGACQLRPHHRNIIGPTELATDHCICVRRVCAFASCAAFRCSIVDARSLAFNICIPVSV